jgi:hypothetical protein
MLGSHTGQRYPGFNRYLFEHIREVLADGVRGDVGPFGQCGTLDTGYLIWEEAPAPYGRSERNRQCLVP